MKRFLLAIDAGGTFLKSALFADGELCRDSFYSVAVDSDGGTAEQVHAAYSRLISAAVRRAETLDGRICRVCVDTPGPFDYVGGVPLMQHKYRAIYGISLIPWIREAAGDVEVAFVHDSEAFVLGAARQTVLRPVAGAMLGTGLGFALTDEAGQPRRRPDGGPLVSLYREPLRGVCAEELISGRGIVARYNAASPGSPAETAKQVGDRARGGDAAALEVYRETGALLGEVVRPVLERYGVRAFIVGGQIARDFALMEAGLRESLDGLKALEYIAAAEDIDNVHLFGAARA